MSAHPPGDDPWADAAALIAEAGRSAEDARRYRDLALAVAEPSLERALAIGSEVRVAARRGTPGTLAPLVAELRQLVARCREAIAAVHASARYREAVLAFRNGDAGRLADLASAIFADVTPHRRPRRLFWSFPIASRSAEHFLPVPECAARIDALKREGIPAASVPPERGGDALIRPVVLSEGHDPSESPIALAIEPSTLPGPVCRLQEGQLVLFYAERLAADFTVACAARAEDEWWRVRPAAYRTYIDELREALSARSLALVIDARGLDEGR